MIIITIIIVDGFKHYQQSERYTSCSWTLSCHRSFFLRVVGSQQIIRFLAESFHIFLIRLKGQIFWKRCIWKEPSSVQPSRGIFSGEVIESGAAFRRTSSTSLVWLLMKVSPLNSDEEGFFLEERSREGGLRILEWGRQRSLSFIPSFNHFFFMWFSFLASIQFRLSLRNTN